VNFDISCIATVGSLSNDGVTEVEWFEFDVVRPEICRHMGQVICWCHEVGPNLLQIRGDALFSVAKCSAWRKESFSRVAEGQIDWLDDYVVSNIMIPPANCDLSDERSFTQKRGYPSGIKFACNSLCSNPSSCRSFLRIEIKTRILPMVADPVSPSMRCLFGAPSSARIVQ
jgi:hypothetical protein